MRALPILLAIAVSLAQPLRGSAQGGDVSPVATSGEPAGYRAIVDEAVSEHEAGNFAEAHTLYLRAHAMWPSARTLHYLGMTEFELKRYADCIAHLEQALASDVRRLDSEAEQEATQLIVRARRFMSTITLEVSPRDARVLVDGDEPRKDAEGSLLLDVGRHRIELSANGYHHQQREVLIKGGGPQRLRFTLEPTRSAQPAALSLRDEEQDTSIWQSPWLWAGAGACAATLAAVAVVLLLSPQDTVVRPVGTPNTPPRVAIAALIDRSL